MRQFFDVLIIGAGVIGNAVARELARYRLCVGVLEKEPDLCLGTSARNSGVLHAGFNNRPGSRMAKYCVAGNRTFHQLAQELDIPYRQTGKLVVGFTQEDQKHLLKMKADGDQNGVPGLRLVDNAFIRARAPYISGEFALWSPSTAILNPFLLTIGLAENAAKNGVSYFLNHEVTAIDTEDKLYRITAGNRLFYTRWVINCAGLGSAAIAKLLGMDGYRLYPNRGEYFVLDKQVGAMLPLPAYPVPNPKEGGLGIHLTPTIDGNVLIGPSTAYIDQPDDYACTRRVLESLIQDGSRIFPHIKPEHFIRNFSGLRPKLTPAGGYDDFVIERHPEAPHAVNLVGIESPGLTSALPIAQEVVRLMQEAEELLPNPSFDPIRQGILTFQDKTPDEQSTLIRNNADYGEIICRCETITRAEVLAAIRGPLGATTVAGVKYRCRAMMGRCQGGYCQTRIADLLMRETGQTREQLLLHKTGSYLFSGKVREA